MSKTSGLALLLTLLGASAWLQASAQTAAPSADDMIRQLTAPPPPASGPTRGFRVRTEDAPPGATAPPEQKAAARAAHVEDEPHPAIGVPLLFDLNSAHLKAESMPVIAAMAQALTSPQLRGAKILIEGHTDASGSAARNRGLSKQRADAVKAALVQAGGVDAGRLSTVGKGESGLANPGDPLAAENRRVVLVNLSGQS